MSNSNVLCQPVRRASSPTPGHVIPYVLLAMTAVTGLVDAVSFLSLGRVFTANMTGNIVLLAFATAQVSGLSVARSLTALLAFLVGAILGGRVMARTSADARIRFAAQAFFLEVAFLLRNRIPKRSARRVLSTVCSDSLDGARDGHTQCRCPEARNPGSDNNSPDTDDHGHRRRLFARERHQPAIGDKGCICRCDVFGCGDRCSRYTLLDLSGPAAGDRNLRCVLCSAVSVGARV